VNPSLRRLRQWFQEHPASCFFCRLTMRFPERCNHCGADYKGV
jgi:hypothetical protein